MSQEQQEDKDLDLASASASEWNKWKQKKQEENPDQIDTKLSVIFSNRPFQNFDLSKVKFWGNTINNCCFRGTNLSEAIFEYHVQINDSNFTKANLKKADLRGVIISNTDFTEADLQQAKLNGELTDVDLSYANLIDVNINSSKFTRVKFNQCVITPRRFTYDKGDGVLRPKFTDIECNFVYLDDSKTKRYPPIGCFVAGEFEKFIKGEIDMNDPQKNRDLLDGSDDDFRSELNSVNTNDERVRLRDEVDFLRKRLSSLELQEKIDNHKKRKVNPSLEIILPILIVSIIFMAFSWFLINKIDREKIEVSVNYDVGLIMGGVLTGSAALIAALSYAKRNNKSNQSNRE